MKSLFVKMYIYLRKLLIGSGIGKFRIINIVNNFLLSYMKKDYVIIFGNKMFLDKYDALELSLNKIYEPEETKLIKNLVKKGDVVLDIGAHVGYYTLILADLVGVNGKVFAFEADKSNFELLKKNVEINNCNNVIVENLAITDKVGQIKLFDVGESSNLTVSDTGNIKFTNVNSISLDEYFKDYNGKIDFIKMDIEGAEYSVLVGSDKLLNRNKDIKIISEFYPFALNLASVSPKDYLNLLVVVHNFKIYIIDEEHKVVSLTNLSVLLQNYNIDNRKITNLFCTKNEVNL